MHNMGISFPGGACGLVKVTDQKPSAVIVNHVLNAVKGGNAMKKTVPVLNVMGFWLR